MINGLKATKKIVLAYNEAKTAKLQIKTLDKIVLEHTSEIKSYMGECHILFGSNGSEIATYKPTKPRVILNEEKLKTLYPEIYNECAEEREGSRVFLLK